MPKVPYIIPGNPPFCSFASLSVFSLTYFNKTPEYSRELTVFMISFFSLLEVINLVVPDLKTFFWIPASTVEDAPINTISLSALLFTYIVHFSLMGNQSLIVFQSVYQAKST